MTLYPTPEQMFVKPDPFLHKYRRAFRIGLHSFRQARHTRRAIAVRADMEAQKMARFVRNCAMNGRVHGMEWN